MIGLITNLDIYFSSACNLTCPYCCMRNLPLVDNTLIRQALKDGSFTQYIKNNLTNNIKSIGFWGLEPTVNADYFQYLIYELLNYSPYIQYIIIPTNGTNIELISKFIKPVDDYCAKRLRKLKMIIQISLDGPAIIQNSHCPNSFDKIKNVLLLIYLTPLKVQDTYFKLLLLLKPTFTASDLTLINPFDWQTFMRDGFDIGWDDGPHILSSDPLGKINYNYYHPTMEVPGNYTKEDGINLCKWNIPFDTSQVYECAAGITSKTIDYQGNLYDCHMLCNKVKSIQDLRPDFENKMNQLVAAGEVIELDRDKLFNAISSIYCWATGNEEISESYIKLLGNGAIL